MAKHLKILSAALLIALAGGCDNNEEPIRGIVGPVSLRICFIDSEGQDLLTGITSVGWNASTVKDNGPFVADNSDLNIEKTFINDREIQVPVIHVGLGYGYAGLPYKNISFAIDHDYLVSEDISTGRWEIVFPYMFGNDEVHTLTVELDVTPGGYRWYKKLWFDGVEASPAYYEWDTGADKKPMAFIVRVDR
ncbi:MAG: hypothetical protein LBK65_00780 [Tannerellaceae bacterium]|nr:hypothetical protein [Tannerellaceae bacterium]